MTAKVTGPKEFSEGQARVSFCNRCHGRTYKTKDGRKRCRSCKSYIRGANFEPVNEAGQTEAEVAAESNKNHKVWWLAMGLFMGV